MQRLVALFALVAAFAVCVNAGVWAADSSEPQGSERESNTRKGAELGAAWGLDERELARFQMALRVMQPFVDENISPLEVLGIAADNEQQRRRYAERFVQAQREHHVRALQWAIHVEQAALQSGLRAVMERDPLIQGRLNSEVKRLDSVQAEYFGAKPSALPTASTGGSLDTSHWPTQQMVPGRIVVFVEPGCTACDNAFEGAMRSVQTGTADGVDVVFAAMREANRDVITAWAVDNGIEASDVGARRVTLNFESARWESLRANRAVPLVIGQ